MAGEQAVAARASAAPARPELVSVVVCTTGRRASLWQLLDSVTAVADDQTEVLVVENAASPGLDVDRLAQLGVRHVFERRLGLDVARNRGAREATGEVVAYVDDDCLVDDGWLLGLRQAFADPEVDLVTGRVVPASLVRPSERSFEACFPWDRGVIPTRFTRTDARPWYPASMHHLGTGCNMAFRRTALLQLGGFDEALDMGSLIGGGGDMDVFARALDAGLGVAYEPSALVRHRHRTSMRDLRWQVWGYGLAQGAVAAKGVATRRGVRAAVGRFWLFRLRTRWRDVRRVLRRRGALPRSVILLEAVGMTVGPAVYLPSRVQAWLRRRLR